MSTSARVNSKRCIGVLFGAAFLVSFRRSETKGRTREDGSGLPPLDSAPSASARPEGPRRNRRQWTGLRPAPQPPRSGYRGSFGGQPSEKVASASSAEKPLSPRRPKQIGTARPATHGLRTSTKKDPV